MKVIFKVANATRPSRPKISSTTTTPEPQVFFADKNKYYPVVTQRPPYLQQEQDKSTVETAKKVLRDFQKYQNEVAVKQEASRMHTNVADSAAAAATAAVSRHAAVLYLTLALAVALQSC